MCVSSTKHSKLVSFAHMKLLYFKTFSFKMNTKLAVAKTIKPYQTTTENEWDAEYPVQRTAIAPHQIIIFTYNWFDLQMCGEWCMFRMCVFFRELRFVGMFVLFNRFRIKIKLFGLPMEF